MAQLARKMKESLEQGRSIAYCGSLLNEGWQLKKTLASGISGGQIDDWYDRARSAGAWGGKLLGAGGGGFLMVLCDPAKQAAVKAELSELRPIPIELESFGSKIIFVG